MTPRQFFYPRVVLEFYHTMTSRGAPSELQLQFNIDGHPRVLRAMDITASLGLPVVLVNSTDYRQRPQPSPREMVDKCKTHICFEFISHDILCILYPYSCKTHKISFKLGFLGLLMKSN